MRFMGWSYLDWYSLPRTYQHVLIDLIREELQTAQRANQRRLRTTTSRR
jgi:hypothetical protein